MRIFKDSNGGQWIVRITLDSVQRVWAACNIDLSNASTVLQKLSESGPSILAVLFHVVKTHDGRRPASPEAFGEVLDGESFEAAKLAMLEALSDFFQSGPNGKMFSALLKKSQEIQLALSAEVERRMEATTPEKVLSWLENSGSLAAKPASTHAT